MCSFCAPGSFLSSLITDISYASQLGMNYGLQSEIKFCYMLLCYNTSEFCCRRMHGNWIEESLKSVIIAVQSGSGLNAASTDYRAVDVVNEPTN